MKRFFYDNRKKVKLRIDLLVYDDESLRGKVEIYSSLTSLETKKEIASYGNGNLKGTVSLLRDFSFIPEVRGVVRVLEKYERVWRKSVCSHFLDSHPDALDVGKWYLYKNRDIYHSKYWAVIRMVKEMAEKGVTEYTLSDEKDIRLFSITESELKNREGRFYSQEDFSKKSDLVNLLYEVYEETRPKSEIPVDFGGYEGIVCPICGHAMGKTFRIYDRADIETLAAFEERRKTNG